MSQRRAWRHEPQTCAFASTLAALAVLVAVASPCRADEAAPDWRGADPAVDRSLLGPTAQTLREGDLSISDYEIVALGLSYGATDRVEVSFTTSIPVLHFAGVLAVKARVITSRFVTVAAQAALGYVYNVRSTHVLTPALLGLVDLHTPDGLLVWSNSIGLAQPFSFGEDWSGRNTTVPLWSLTTGPIVRVNPHVRLLANLVLLGGFGQVHAVSQPRSTDFTVWAFVAYGVRLSSQRVSLDLALGRTVVGWWLDDGWAAAGFPLFALTVRF